MNGQLDKLYNSPDTVIYNANSNKNQEEKSLLKGILLGEKEELTEQQIENFKVSSLSHILAVSGMHIAYIILGVMFIFKLLGIAKPKIHILTILVVIFFMFLTEFTPSVVRASIMAILVLIAFLAKRKANVWINISISSLIILMCNPYTLLSLSYQLSYLGTIGIVLGMKVLNNYREKNKNINSDNTKEVVVGKIYLLRKRAIRFVIETVVVCLSAQLFIFPIILLNFNTVSIYFLISNLLIAPIIGIVVILGFLIILGSYICYPLAYYLNFVEFILLKFINIMTNFITNLPNSIIYLKTPYILSIVIYFSVILIFVGIYTLKTIPFKRKIKKHNKLLKKFLKTFLVMYLIIILAIDFGVFNTNSTKIYFVDVGQGDCTLIVTDKNKKILIDGGGNESDSYDVGKNTTLPYLLDRRISKLDYVLISHFDADHVKGLFAVLEHIKVDKVIISKQKENSKEYEKFLKIVESRKINIVLVKAGDRIKLDKNSYIDILWPTEKLEISENPLNNNSIVTKFVYKEFSILFTGDIEEKAEKAILRKYSSNLNALKSTALKVAHHGSKTSTTEEFLEAVKPKYALIGVGKNNIFGHPSNVTLERLKRFRILFYRTDENGEIILKIDEKNILKLGV